LVRLIGGLDPASIPDSALMRSLAQKGCLEYGTKLVPRQESQRAIAESECLLLLDLNERGTGLQVPAKIFEYIRLGRHIFTFTYRNSSACHILERAGVPYCCIYPDTPDQELDERVLDMMSIPTQPVSPSRWFAENFDGRLQAGTVARIIDRLVPVSGRKIE
jgi:hypothetical protein